MEQKTQTHRGVGCTECNWSGDESETEGKNGCPNCGFPVRAVYER